MEEKPQSLTPMQDALITALNEIIKRHISPSMKVSKDVASTKVIDFVDFLLAYIQCFVEECSGLNPEQAAAALMLRIINLNKLQERDYKIDLPGSN